LSILLVPAEAIEAALRRHAKIVKRGQRGATFFPVAPIVAPNISHNTAVCALWGQKGQLFLFFTWGKNI
jgi:hypothetical protein